MMPCRVSAKWYAARTCSGRPACTGCCSDWLNCPNRTTGIIALFVTRQDTSFPSPRGRPDCASCAPRARARKTFASFLAYHADFLWGQPNASVTLAGRPCHGEVGEGAENIMAARSRDQGKTRAPKKRRPARKRQSTAKVAEVRERAAAGGVVEAALAVFAHEVRTPLTGILAISDLLATSELGERERRWVDTIKAGAEHLASLATLFVDAAKQATAPSNLRQDLFDVHALAQNAGDSLAGRAAAKGLQSSVEISERLVSLVTGDPVRLRAALEN